MKAGTLLFIVADVVALLSARGILLPSGDFDEAKLDSIQEDVELAAAVAAVLEQHGVNVPDRVQRILAIVPLVAGFVR